MKISGLPNESSSDWRSEVSRSGASTSASTSGARGTSNFIISQPRMPKAMHIQTVPMLSVAA
jgi:hypothetical protein